MGLRTTEIPTRGVSPASIELQKVVDYLFGDMEHVVAIFDNLLVLKRKSNCMIEWKNSWTDASNIT